MPGGGIMPPRSLRIARSQTGGVLADVRQIHGVERQAAVLARWLWQVTQ